LRGNQYGPSVTLERNDDLKCYVLPGFVFEVGSVFDD
jgi:hypothetical protein